VTSMRTKTHACKPRRVELRQHPRTHKTRLKVYRRPDPSLKIVSGLTNSICLRTDLGCIQSV
jgi:hypothetical protein